MLLCFVRFRIGGGREERRDKKPTVEIITSGRLAGTSQAGQNILGRRPQITIKSGSQAVRLLHKAFHSGGSAMLNPSHKILEYTAVLPF